MPKVNYITPTGDDFIINLAFFEADGVTPDNISGDTITLLLKPFDDVPDADASVQSFTGVITNASGGIAYVEIVNATTINLLGTYYYKLKILTSGGIETTFAYGVISFTSRGSTLAASSPNNLIINMSAGTAIKDTFEQDTFTPTNGQTVFNLSYAPRLNSPSVYYNGVITPPTNYSIAANVLTWSGVALTTLDKLMVTYVQN